MVTDKIAKAITIKNLSKTYHQDKNAKSFKALDGLNLEIKQGSIFGLLGSNGAGKSTLINILAGTTVKDYGEITILGQNIDLFPKAVKMSLGVVPQEVVVDTFFSLEQTLEFTAGYYGIPTMERKTEEILVALGLWEKRKNLPRQLSGGMKRRFLVAKAMVHSPKLLILDEPTAGVDIELRDQLWSYVKKLNEQGTTIIVTTHYLAEAQSLCDEIAFINKGKIIRQDSKDNLLQELGSRFLEIEFDSELDKKIELLKDFSYEITGLNKLQINLKSNNQVGKCNYNKLLGELNNIGLTIKNLQISEHNLEKIFYQMMQ